MGEPVVPFLALKSLDFFLLKSCIVSDEDEKLDVLLLNEDEDGVPKSSLPPTCFDLNLVSKHAKQSSPERDAVCLSLILVVPPQEAEADTGPCSASCPSSGGEGDACRKDNF